jgi:uncharacterized FAD-dependent dehydrogenase
MPQKIELVLLPEEAAREEDYPKYISSFLGVANPSELNIRLLKRSIDARSRQPKYRLIFEISRKPENLPETETSVRHYRDISNAEPVLIAGFGPAGMFAALRLIELGYKPVIIERGKDVRSRRRDLALINRQGVVDPDSNYCFGEGGAGTYSDGKLYTRSDKRGNLPRILQTFIDFGAEADIAIDAHPHIGTNKLPGIVTALREQILQCGGEVLFGTRVENILRKDGKFSGLSVAEVNNPENKYSITAKALLLATGHSARDVFRMLHQQNLLIEAKDFALGVRIEHPQLIIDQQQYHASVRDINLPPASYSLTTQAEGRGVYSFCMCPGGIIAPAATAPGEIVVNGWSPSKRNNPFANSGMVVSVGAEDFRKYAKEGPLAAMAYQSAVEQKCFAAGGKTLAAPAQRLTDFCDGKGASSLPGTSYIPGVVPVKLSEVLPSEITLALKKGLQDFGKKMKGYYTSEAVLVATESRTSSPVRIPRDRESLMHPQLAGLFPCAEGAGYAGGIISAAMDGERCADGIDRFMRGE